MPYNEHLRQQWIDKGYSRHMGSAAVIPPPPDGLRPLYHLTSAEYAITDIVFGRLKVARFSALNDPFELMARSALHTPIQRSLDYKKQLDSKSGLLCFSEDWTNPVLWTHYGANHRGICLGFTVKEEFAKQITYQNDRLRDEEIRGKTEKEILDLLVYTKFESWRYEQERRVLLNLDGLANEGGLYFYGFNEQLRLREVVLGVECTMVHKAVEKLVSTHYPDVNTIQARFSFGEFCIVPDEDTITHIPASTHVRNRGRP
jgi:Protein of unknown function (DUF2971)